MRKKELLNQNMSLFEDIQSYKLEITRLQNKIKEKDKTIASLNEKLSSALENKKEEEIKIVIENIEQKEDEYKDSDPIIAEENLQLSSYNNETEEQPLDSEEAEYGARVIGELVISSAEYSNKLTENGDTSNKELLNLILGRNEVAKSEILSVVYSKLLLQEKKESINKIKAETLEYFESVWQNR